MAQWKITELKISQVILLLTSTQMLVVQSWVSCMEMSFQVNRCFGPFQHLQQQLQYSVSSFQACWVLQSDVLLLTLVKVTPFSPGVMHF